MGGSCSNSEDRELKGGKAKQLRGSGIQAVAAEARENVEGKTRQLQHQADAPPKHVGAAAEGEADDAVAKALVLAEESLQRAEREQALAMAEEPEIVGATVKLQRKALPPGAAWKIAHQRIRALNVTVTTAYVAHIVCKTFPRLGTKSERIPRADHTFSFQVKADIVCANSIGVNIILKVKLTTIHIPTSGIFIKVVQNVKRT